MKPAVPAQDGDMVSAKLTPWWSSAGTEVSPQLKEGLSLSLRNVFFTFSLASSVISKPSSGRRIEAHCPWLQGQKSCSPIHYFSR